METTRSSRTSPFLYISVAGLFLIIISRALLSDGLFMDGMMYSTMAKNLSHGLGTFWEPHLTNTFFPVFINHPPLAIGIESLFFRLFGDSRYVERFYSLFTMMVTGFLIVKIWKSAGNESSTGWLPLLFWTITPTVTWTSVNNMLENTMGVFICLSILFYLKTLEKHNLMPVIFSGFVLSLGFLTKGLVTFFPLTFPFFVWLATRRIIFRKAVRDTLLMSFAAIVPLLLLFFFTKAGNVFPRYFNVTFNLIADGVTKDNRFFIIHQLFMELIPGLIMIIITALLLFILKLPLKQFSRNIQMATLFFLLGLSGVLPIMITRVQSGYYLETSLPFFAVAMSMFALPAIEIMMEKIIPGPLSSAVLKAFCVAVFITGIVLSIAFSGTINRDREMILDTRAILPVLEENSDVNILPEMKNNWSLHVYFARSKNISLDPDLNRRFEYLIVQSSLCPDTLQNSYENIDLNTHAYLLFKRRNNKK